MTEPRSAGQQKLKLLFFFGILSEHEIYWAGGRPTEELGGSGMKNWPAKKETIFFVILSEHEILGGRPTEELRSSA